MRNVLLFVVLISNTKIGTAQITHHFPHTDAVWGQFEGVYYDNISGNDYYVGGSHFYAAGGDSLLNGYSYIKVYGADAAGTIFNYPPRLIREDFDKVYYYDPYLQDDTLLYDFSLQPGDTARVYSDHNIFTLLVDSTGLIQAGNQIRKCIYFATTCGEAIFNQQNFFAVDNTPVMWVEGIGSNDGLFTPGGGGGVVDGIVFLTCFRENDTLKYGTECNLIYDGGKDPLSDSEFEIFPNPTSGNIVIQKNNFLHQETELTLYSLTGKKVWRKYIPAATSILEHVDLAPFPEGLYLLQVTSPESNYTEKIQVFKK